MTVTITPSEGDIENNIVPLDLLVTDEDRSTAMAINGTPVANTQNTGATPPPPDSNIIKSGNGSVVKGFLKSHNYSPGDSGWIIKGNGDVEFSDGVFRGDISAATGTIGGWTIGATFIGDNAVANDATVLLDSTNSLIRLGATSGDYITLDGGNVRLRSSNYVTGVSGFTIQADLVEAENIVARGILRGSTFAYDVISAIGGQLMVANADALDADMTALDASTLTTKDTTDFAVNDILVIRGIATSGIDEEWLRVTNIGSAPTYTVTRDLASSYAANSNPIWKAGTPVVKQGSSDGASTFSGGWLRLYGEGTNSPYYSVFRRTGVAYNTITEAVRLGNLNGIAGFSSDTYGFYTGDISTNNYLVYDTTSGEMIINGSSVDQQSIYGDGSDGDVTTSGDVGLTADVYYNNLTISAGDTLTTNGYRVFVRETLTIAATGVIGWKGVDGGAGGDGDDATAGGPGNGGTAGAAGAALTDGYLTGSVAGIIGVVGAAGVTGSPGKNGIAGTSGNTGNNGQTNSLGNDGNDGGAGGNGGNISIWTGGAGGAKGAGGTEGASATIVPHNAYLAIRMIDESTIGSPAAYTINASGGSAGSGGSGSSDNGGKGSGAGGGSGGSGSGAGIGFIAAKLIINVGTINYSGGVGGDGGDGGKHFPAGSFAADGGGGGGGAGGNGGYLVLIYNKLTNTGTIFVAGGTGGTGGTGVFNGDDGEAGNDGTLVELAN